MPQLRVATNSDTWHAWSIMLQGTHRDTLAVQLWAVGRSVWGLSCACAKELQPWCTLVVPCQGSFDGPSANHRVTCCLIHHDLTQLLRDGSRTAGSLWSWAVFLATCPGRKVAARCKPVPRGWISIPTHMLRCVFAAAYERTPACGCGQLCPAVWQAAWCSWQPHTHARCAAIAISLFVVWASVLCCLID